MYFDKFPLIDYPFLGKNFSTESKSAIDITLRLRFLGLVKNNSSNFLKYEIRDGERADTLASRLYGRSDLHWAIYLINDIINPYFSWPLFSNDIDRFIDEKYNGSSLFCPEFWKKTTSIFLSSEKSLDQIKTLNDTQAGFSPQPQDIQLVLASLQVGSKVKVISSGILHDTEILNVNSNFYEITVERRPWVIDDQVSTRNAFIIVEVSKGRRKFLVKVPITRFINERRFSIHHFEINGESRDPSQSIDYATISYDALNPDNLLYNNISFPGLNEVEWVASTNEPSLIDGYVSLTDERLPSSYFVTNEEHERLENEKKRLILIPKPEAVTFMVRSMKNLLENR